jgi:CBS domain-containing protein
LSELNIAINEPVSKFVQSPILVDVNESVNHAAKLMVDRKSGSVIVTKNNEPVGIVTEWDVLSRVVAQGKDPAKTAVKDVMSSPVLFVSAQIKTGEAISLMVRNKYRRLLVKDGTKLIGIITLSQVVGNSREGSISLPMLEPSKGARCPYCGSILKDREDLSNHIDNVHIREEMLKGAHGLSS